MSGIGKALKRQIKKLFKCPQDRHLIMVWREQVFHNPETGQTETTSKIKLGRYTMLSWVSFYTPVAEWRQKMEQD